MKKIISILIFFVYLVSTTGIFIVEHFCGGKLHSVKFSLIKNIESESTCDCETNSCCENNCVDDNDNCFEEILVLKLDEPSIINNIKTPFENDSFLHSEKSSFYSISFNKIAHTNLYHHKIPIVKNPLFILNSSLLV